MEKRLDCREIGLDCDFTVCGQTDEELLKKLGEHIQGFHAMKGFSRDFYQKALASVREGSCEIKADEEASCDECCECVW